jgi:hypothetical protein
MCVCVGARMEEVALALLPEVRLLPFEVNEAPETALDVPELGPFRLDTSEKRPPTEAAAWSDSRSLRRTRLGHPLSHRFPHGLLLSNHN